MIIFIYIKMVKVYIYQTNKPEVLAKFDLVPTKEKEYSGIITLYRGVAYNEGNNFYSPSKEFVLQFTRTNRESELIKVRVNTNKIYKHNPLPYWCMRRFA